jgi:hypothetical protein
VKKRYSVVFFIAIVTTVAIVFSACKKLNDSTELGGDLIPVADNITTFDTMLTVQAFNDTFTNLTDSLRLLYTEEHFLGRISNDPFFGTTDAKLFLELKPTFYPFNFKVANKDSLHIDSVVMVLSYAETYGDSTVPQTVNVYELDQSNPFTKDSAYLVRQNNFTYSNLLGTRTFIPNTLDDSIKVLGDTSSNQLRIKLSNAFGQRLLNYDSTSNLVSGAYLTDSAFRTKFKGFALESVSGNAVMGFDVSAVNTKLAIYYRVGNAAATHDTVQAYFTLNTDNSFNNGGATANYVKRNYTGRPVAAAAGQTTPASIIYLQNDPGAFAILKIPGLATMSNRTIHRAELVVEELYDISDNMFPPPDFLYLDAADPTIATVGPKFRTIPYDFQYDVSGAPNLTAFGIDPINAIDVPSGQTIKTWHFNISRYVQHVLTHTQSSYDLRLMSPYVVTDQFGTPPAADVLKSFQINSSIVKGRVRLVGNTGPADVNPHRVRLHIVYSKL